MPTKLPSDYHIVNETNDRNMKSIAYGNESDGFILFQQHNENSGIHVDTEEADEVFHTRIHGQEGLLVRKNEMMTLVWQEGMNLFVLMESATNLKKEEPELIEIAESVLLLK